MGNGDYVPLDLGPVYNAGLDVLGEGVTAAVGEQTFLGIPFRIGRVPAAPDCLILLSGHASSGPVIPVGQPAQRLIFAHRLLESEVYDGGPIGKPVADYVVRYDGGDEVRIEIRERFEIGIPDDRWTQRPFLAMADQDYTLPPRFAGRWEDAGLRQTEMAFDTDVSYYLFPWRNPHPDRVIREVELVPRGPRFVLAAITLGHRDEHPFRHSGPRDVVVTLPDPADAASGRDVAVRVDRGLAAYSYTLPAEPGDAPTVLRRPGWGERRNPASSPATCGSPPSRRPRVSVALGDEELGQVAWSDLESGGRVEASPRVHVELIDRGQNWVRTTVVDDETGRPIPCRVHFQSAEGIPYAPHGHHDDINSGLNIWHVDVGGDVRMGHTTYAYTDGTCEGWLPRGEVVVDVAQGFEYEPLRSTVTIAPGQQELELRLRRWTDMNARRWFSGDTHVHFLSPQGGIFEARGEGLNVVNLLQAQWGNLFTNTEDFTGAPLVSSDGRTIVYASQENRQHVLGHMSLLGLKRPVMPWSSDGLGEGGTGGTLETTMSDWADRCHAQGGTVIIPHFPSPNGETAVLIATGRADGVEMIRYGRYEHLTYYRYLNAGYRVPLVGGTDKMSSDVPVGLYRTYVRIPPDDDFTYESWCRNLKLGRTFMSGGPIIHFTVDGHEIGDTLKLPAGGGTVEVAASAESIFPIHTLEIVLDGKVVASTADEAGARKLELHEKLVVSRNAWLTARVGGPGYWNPTRHNDEWNRAIMAHTSPVYVAVGGAWSHFDAEVSADMLNLVSGALQYVQEVSPQFPVGSVSHHHGRPDHAAFLARPYEEAMASIRKHLAEAPKGG